MIAFPPSQRIFMRDDASDMRLGYDGLANLVVNALGCDPRSGDLFVFVYPSDKHISENPLRPSSMTKP